MLERRPGAHAGALEVDRIEVHPDVRPVDTLEDLAADLRMERGAVVVFEVEAHVRVPVGQAPAGSGTRSRGRAASSPRTSNGRRTGGAARRRAGAAISTCRATERSVSSACGARWKKSHHPPDTTQMRRPRAAARSATASTVDAVFENVMQVQIDVAQVEPARRSPAPAAAARACARSSTREREGGPSDIITPPEIPAPSNRRNSPSPACPST